MANVCPICRHDFSLGESLKIFNPFNFACPSCGIRLYQRHFVAVLAVFLVCLYAVFCLTLKPWLDSVSTLDKIGSSEFWFCLVASLGGVGLIGLFMGYLCWWVGWPPFAVAQPRHETARVRFRLFGVIFLPAVLILMPTLCLWWAADRIEENSDYHLDKFAGRKLEMEQKKLTLQESRDMILRIMDRRQEYLKMERNICRALKFYAASVLVGTAWLVFGSARRILRSSEPSSAKQKSPSWKRQPKGQRNAGRATGKGRKKKG